MRDSGGWRWWKGAAVVLGSCVLVGRAAGQATAAVTVSPVALVRRAVQLRLEEEKSHRPVRYVLRKTDGDHETTKEIIETG